MKRKIWLPLVAVGLFSFMGFHLMRTHQDPPELEPLVTPARAPFTHAVAAAGIVEARTENIAVGSIVPGVVAQVQVVVGDRVAAGDVLFRLDDRQMQAEMKVREAQLAAAKSNLERLLQMPRPEEIPPSEARVRRARAELTAEQDLYDRRERLVASRAISEEELIQRRQTLAAAREAFAQAEAEHALLIAGSWERDREVARADVARAQSAIDQTRTELDRLVVRAPVAGEILNVDVRPGEYVGTPPGQPLVMIGDTRTLHVRVDVDESDIPRFRPGSKGRAFVRGDGDRELPLRFVRVEPYVQPKTALTGAGSELVDTRVLQVIYALEQDAPGVYVGQQVDVYLESTSADAKPSAKTVAANIASAK